MAYDKLHQITMISCVFACCVFLTGAISQDQLAPEASVRVLQQGNHERRSALAKVLQIEVPAWARNAPEPAVCTDYSAVKLDYVTLRRPGPQAVVQVDSADSCSFTYILVFDRNESGQWLLTGTIPLFGIHRKPAISFESLVRDDEHEIVGRGYAYDSGSGFSQANMVIVKQIDGHLEVVFSEAEKSYFFTPRVTKGQPDNIEQVQESTFSFEREKEIGKGKMAIVERQLIRDQRSKITRWREYHWIPELKRFQPYSTFRER